MIIGGGVAGLSALNRLADLGVPATLVEGGDYPAHKICGEFFSPESAFILKEWDLIATAQINRVSFTSNTSSLSFSIPTPAQSQARYDFDCKLAKRAKEKGVVILTNTKVVKIENKELHLDNGNILPFSEIIISAGRFYKSGAPQYFGIKGHLKGLDVENHLEMFPFDGGYGGLSPIGGNLANFACLIRAASHTMPTLIESVFQKAPHLKKRLEQGELIFKDWMTCPVPAFGIKKPPEEPHTYYIGDAAGTIPPASGLGLSLALTSGYMVAGYALKGDYTGFRAAWKKKYTRVFRYGNFLHQLMMNQTLSHLGIKLGRSLPKIPPRIFQMTRIGS